MSLGQGLITKLSKLCFAVASVALVVMALHIFMDFIGRLLGFYLDGTLEFTSFYYMIFAVFLGASYAQQKNVHIATDVLTNLLPQTIQTVVIKIGLLVQIAFYAILSYQTLLDAISSYESSEEAMANFTFYIWPSKWALPIGFISLTLVVILQLFSRVDTKSEGVFE
ncbi:TRAP transporter small permease [Pelistega europaea]|uniref:TRAP transporter small permease protein n=1 Tax=Pelistega europaea TaxID=106147 RepID=A0A7Y4LAK1_9BURK|nr:TRAP transporter small permease [Pelistega europaea]NOL50044.1 TRAP transporter small permease [Pelistega europaea]